MTERIFFDFDKSVLKPESQALLKKKADWLKANPATKMLIEGNTDERGTAEYNLALGERRAESAKKFLVDLGIDAKRISTISYGEERPLDPRQKEEAWAKNRNDGFVIN
jgi:peptidoglycan-associated lipoprotein